MKTDHTHTNGDEKIVRLIRLKRYERPAPDYEQRLIASLRTRIPYPEMQEAGIPVWGWKAAFAVVLLALFTGSGLWYFNAAPVEKETATPAIADTDVQDTPDPLELLASTNRSDFPKPGRLNGYRAVPANYR